MKKNHIIFAFIGIASVCILVIWVYHSSQRKNLWEWFYQDSKSVLRYYRVNDKMVTSASSLPIMEIFKEALLKLDIQAKQSEFAQAELLQFETLNNIDNLLMNIRMASSVKYIYGLIGSDLMAGKQALYFKMREKLGMNVLHYMPKSYVMGLSDDVEELKQDFSPRNVYIMKKNVQRQQGHLVTRDIDEILANKNSYVIVQEMLQDPFIVNKRKINMRIYLLIVMHNDKEPLFYIYNNGFMYYTPKFFKPNSVDTDEILTSGYVDRQVYKENPLTIKDLFTYLGSDKSDKLQHSLVNLFVQIRHTFQQEILDLNKGRPGTKFLIYGCDIAPDEHLNCKIMEINKGPDLTYKDERDKEVKLGIMVETLSLVGIAAPLPYNNFIEVPKSI